MRRQQDIARRHLEWAVGVTHIELLAKQIPLSHQGAHVAQQ